MYSKNIMKSVLLSAVIFFGLFIFANLSHAQYTTSSYGLYGGAYGGSSSLYGGLYGSSMYGGSLYGGGLYGSSMYGGSLG